MKRYLYLLHRWLGVSLCLFMALWFFSGVVMMYVGYPKLTVAQRLAHLPDLGNPAVVPLALAARAVPPEANVSSITLTSVAGKPQYQFGTLSATRQRGIVAVDALSGAKLQRVSADDALRAAHAFMPDAAAQYRDAVNEDSWSHSRSLDLHRPLHRVQMDDPAHTLLYVSSATGDVVRVATRSERLWNFAGAWLHWLYMFRGGPLDGAWTGIVIYLSLAGVLLAVSGSVVGLLRWRFRGRFRSGSKTPYREPVMRWHHLSGLLFGTLAITWIFSGLMSMNPWKMFNADAAPLDRTAYAGGTLQPAQFQLQASDALSALRGDLQAREIGWHRLAGQAYLVATDGNGRTRIVRGAGQAPLDIFPTPQLLDAAQHLSAAPIAETSVLERYDNYYYDRDNHTMMGDAARRLPLLRVKFADAQQTWVHIDPYSGNVVGQLDQRQRLQRWLFSFLHSWDLPPLLASRPLWDIAMILFSIGGLLLSATGIVIAVRRCRVG
ncbi:PepSY domain-containing protein [Collimonas sp. NPDC087041]|uniref:PepSY domain-containing protein n=1 Tax=Collimonas sp. NPDC087041 TaxID=3363960 RepID=UPI00382A55B3